MPIDLIAVIIAIVALLGSIANASLIVWEKRHTERRRRYHALADVVAKYRDPLHLAAEDLAMKISNIINNDFAGWVSESSSRARQDYAIMHTSFVLGRLFCWLYILRRDTQFLLPSRRYDEESGAVRTVLNNIRMTLRTTRDDSLFKVLTGEQEAIGELMTVVDEAYIFAAEGQGNDGGGRRHGGQCRCIGYASFVQRWKQDSEFREWFGSVVNGLRGMNSLSRGVQAGVSLPRRQYPPEERLRRLQHQLVDLIERLDPRGLHSKSIGRCVPPARACLCKACGGKNPHELGPLTSSGTIQEKAASPQNDDKSYEVV